MAKIDEAIYELESPAQVGNLNSTPEYTLSMIEKAVNNATDFATGAGGQAASPRSGAHAGARPVGLAILHASVAYGGAG